MAKINKIKTSRGRDQVHLAEFPELGFQLGKKNRNLFAISRSKKQNTLPLLSDLAIDLVGMNGGIRVILADMENDEKSITRQLAKSVKSLSNGKHGKEVLQAYLTDYRVCVITRSDFTLYHHEITDILGVRIANLVWRLDELRTPETRTFLLVNNPEAIYADLEIDREDAELRLWSVLKNIPKNTGLRVITTYQAYQVESSDTAGRSLKAYELLQREYHVASVEELPHLA